MQLLDYAQRVWTRQSTSNKVGIVVLGILSATLFAYGIGGSGLSFQANLVGGTPKPFDGAIYPLSDTLNWVKLTSTEYSSFKSGALTYDAAKQAGKVMPLPKYDATILQNDPASLGWQGDDLTKRNVLLTYVTAYMGAYTSGTKPAIEEAGSHVGIDIRAAKGTPVYAIANGRVVKSKEDASSGKVVVIEHPDVPSLENPGTKTTYYSVYMHMDTLMATEGQIVDKGAQIGTVGMTGTATTYHLHFQLDKKEAPFHPYWPFTFSEAASAGMDFFTGVNQGLGKEKGLQYTTNAFDWINANVAAPVEATTTTNANTNTTETPLNTNANVINANTNTEVANTNSATTTNLQVSKFTLFYPVVMKTGETAEVTVRGLDASGAISGLGLSENILLTVEGGAGTITPSQLTPGQLATGEARVSFTATSAGSIAIVARSGALSGTGPVMSVTTSQTVTSTNTNSAPVVVSSNNNTGTTTTAPSSITFADVTSTTKHARAIAYLQAKNVIAGYPDGTFKPEQSINRAEVTKVILGGSSIEPLSSVTRVSFTDIFNDDWFAGWVERAKEMGIVSGNPDGSFTPSTTVNKASALKILLLTSQVDLSSVIVIDNPFADVDTGDWFAIYFQYAKDKNLIEADSAGKVYPSAGMSRAEVAEMMYRLIRIKETGAARYSSALDI
ncbi:hypothetical protein COW46_05220 [Candidatus Gracilibacteria bacterium CG17_big_fil_post_rev_8_21_14_2_50_48_13]|nr:MAG: hypothetical protein COW46_05220 [Candidatus Gracilibacteria bacterium CG17_big_fil_post_rev_8_21_14_2_50_48_13]